MGVDLERWQGNNNPHSQEIATRKLKMERKASENARAEGINEDEPIPTGLDCSWCKDAMFDVHYKWKYHKMVFCANCALKTGDFAPKDFPKCRKSRIDKKDCIWERIEAKRA